MTEITADLVRQLREMTGAPMMDTKRALVDAEGDLEAAKQLLRERGMASAGKRAGNQTPEGVVLTRLDDSKGTIVAIGSESEPVSKNDEFRAFAEKVLEVVLGKRFFAENVLAEQAWIHEPKKTVAQALEEEGLNVLEFERYALAE